MVFAVQLPWPVAGRGAAFTPDAQGADLSADRRNRRGAHDVLAGEAGRYPQLGLPLLLAARRDADAAGADANGLLPRGGGMAALAAARRRRQPGADADHVWHSGGASSRGVGMHVAAGL